MLGLRGAAMKKNRFSIDQIIRILAEAETPVTLWRLSLENMDSGANFLC